MGVAHLNIEDADGGTYNVQAVYRCCERSGTDLCFCLVHGFNAEKPSHVAVALLMKHLDTLGARQELTPDELTKVAEDIDGVIITDRNPPLSRKGRRKRGKLL